MDNNELAKDIVKEIEYEYFGDGFWKQYTGDIIEMVVINMLNEGLTRRFIVSNIGDIVSATKQEYGDG